jgi:chromosome segregation ATPase
MDYTIPMSQEDIDALVERLSERVLRRIDTKFAVYFEESDERNRIFQNNIEAVFDKHLDPIRKELAALKDHAHVTTAAVKATNHELRNNSARLTKLEETTSSLKKTVDDQGKSLAENNKLTHSMATALGKAEHRIDMALTLAQDASRRSRHHISSSEKQLADHEQRLANVESNA